MKKIESIKLGIFFNISTLQQVKAKRITKETVIEAEVNLGGRDPKLKEGIDTNIPFLDHMIETVAWRSCVNIGISISCISYKLFHTLAEDSGIILGNIFQELLKNRTEFGIEGNGVGFATLDEALSMVNISFEERSGCFITNQDVNIPEFVETTSSSNMIAFFEGFSQGARATIHLRFLSGRDPHHIWESTFRAFGEALRGSLKKNSWRAGTTVGVKGI
jgi:imidazoleglycerol-phosphate dehydratase